MKRIYIHELIFIILAVCILAACSATTRYQVLSTIFDGVPDPNAKQKQISDSLNVDTLFTNNNIKTGTIKEPEFIYHPPYQNRMCNGCHDMQRGNALIKPIPDLCYRCHENITEKNPALHGPVAMGDCNVCHSPHLAKNKFLLIRKGRDLCFHCHETTYIYENKNHFATEEYDCLDCHDPHGGKDRFLLN
jgi:predicted CXXCH cytochrome family protein